ncbi:GNAT family N-acetyltransferase [Kribbella sp. NPDC059898]|uniref:GNAT family N-acetyltransferase n=1 Tax=Kribbella sp. NPDC059898 TaxID=3346995 RepID=UPI00365DFFB0
MTAYTLRSAVPSDVDDVIELRRYAEEWLKAAGIEQWTSSATGDRTIREHFDDDRTYVVVDDGGYVVASLALGEGDSDFWTADELTEPARYLYKLMAGPTARGIGLGDVLLDWACDRAQRQGADRIRLDCWRTNAGLHAYYLARGFRQYDVRTAPGRKSGALFERPADLRLAVPGRVELVDAT